MNAIPNTHINGDGTMLEALRAESGLGVSRQCGVIRGLRMMSGTGCRGRRCNGARSDFHGLSTGAGDVACLTAAFMRQVGIFGLHPVLERTPWFI